MFRSLYAKIAAGLAALFLFIGILFVGITVFSTDMYQQEVNQKLNLNLAKQIVKTRLLIHNGDINQKALKEIFHMLMVVNPGIEIYLLGRQGEILTYSAPEGSVKREKIDLEPVKRWLGGNAVMPVLGDDPKDSRKKKVFSAARIEQGGQLEGYLYVILGGEHYDSVVQKIKGSYILQLSAGMIFTGVLFTLFTGLLLFSLLTGRLKRLARVMASFRPGDEKKLFDPEANQFSSDEIDRLTMTFKQMAGRIECQMKELKTLDRLRRELVANVSHDLKTPLATLQGYIETLLIKDGQYSEKERRQYLETAINHCNRLNRLVTDLLEIARLESTTQVLHPEVFNFSELVSDIIQAFRLRAREKKIDLVTRFDESPLFVKADIALIERAMENLFENALNYTPESGRVTIEAGLDKDVVVSICDTGPGIDPDALPRIFDRFSHSHKHRAGGDGHAGLGLAITKKIIDLHQREISVTSTVGSGTCFFFSLPSASPQ